MLCLVSCLFVWMFDLVYLGCVYLVEYMLCVIDFVE